MQLQSETAMDSPCNASPNSDIRLSGPHVSPSIEASGDQTNYRACLLMNVQARATNSVPVSNLVRYIPSLLELFNSSFVSVLLWANLTWPKNVPSWLSLFQYWLAHWTTWQNCIQYLWCICEKEFGSVFKDVGGGPSAQLEKWSSTGIWRFYFN